MDRTVSLRPYRGWAAVLAAWLVGLLAGCSSDAPAKLPVARPVKTMVVIAGADSRTRTFSGKVEASRRVELAFRVPGLLVQLPVNEGLQVTQGGLIAQLRQDEIRSAVEIVARGIGPGACPAGLLSRNC